MIQDSGREITVKEALTRNLIRSVDLLPGVYGVGMLSVFLSAQNKRLGDYVAGTVVVHDRAPRRIAAILEHSSRFRSGLHRH